MRCEHHFASSQKRRAKDGGGGGRCNVLQSADGTAFLIATIEKEQTDRCSRFMLTFIHTSMKTTERKQA